MKIKRFFNKNYPLIFSFLTPFILVLLYFISRQMYPFGKNSILTVDLGQQYVDFFAFYRQTLLHSWGNIFYSFGKALGGPMIGEFAYYLLSPFNLVLLLFPGKTITAGIMLVVLLKYGCAGLSFGWLLYQTKLQNSWKIPLFATSYALMGWAIANQSNILWLDALVFLPLIVLNLINLLEGQRNKAYCLWLVVMLISNYYMAYMICLFLCLFFCWHQVQNFTNFKKLISNLWLFAKNSLLAVGCAAVLLLPTVATLQTSKGQYTINHFSWKLEYFPPKLLSKFVIGAFNFDQMPQGFPNLFIGTLGLSLFLLYFLDKRFPLKSRICAFLISSFCFASTFIEPFDLLWHGMQFPVWYPYRFSFLISFWMLYLGAQVFNTRFKITCQKLLLLGIFLTALFAYVCLNATDFSFISSKNLLLFAIFLILTLWLLTLKTTHKNYYLLFYLVIVCEMGCNLFLSLGNLSYLTQADYVLPSTSLAADVKLIQKKKPALYRVGQTYARTKNDALAHNFNSGSYFSSALEKSLPDFYGQLGNPDGDNYVTYTNGTLISDSLLAMRYFFDNKDLGEVVPDLEKEQLSSQSEKSDLKEYSLIGQTDLTQIYQNPFALSLGYGASEKLTDLKVLYNDPISYQTNWLNLATNTPISNRYFSAQNFNEVIFQNTKSSINLTGQTFKRTDNDKDAQIIFKFTPSTNDSYYLTLGPQLSSTNVTWSLGNRLLHYYGTFRHTVVLNLANQDKGNEIVLTAKFKKQNLTLDNFVLYRLNNQEIKKKLQQLQKHQLKITDFNSRKIRGTITASKKQSLLATTIPYSKGWHIKVDGHKVETLKIQDTFLACKLSPGKHHVELFFVPPYLYLGLFISFISLLILLLSNKKLNNQRA